jgi:hypothetical protein
MHLSKEEQGRSQQTPAGRDERDERKEFPYLEGKVASHERNPKHNNFFKKNQK